eukprot:scaffold51305_cov22-Tisochrysis_lutea.AAC.3
MRMLLFVPTCALQRVCLVGGLPEMGSWQLESALELKWHEGHEWKLSMPLPRARSSFEFKHVTGIASACSSSGVKGLTDLSKLARAQRRVA